MNIIGAGTLYQVIEFDRGIMVLNALDRMMDRPGAKVLVVGSAAECGEYLMVYLHARSGGAFAAVGKDMLAAHRDAKAIVPGTRKGDLDS